MLAVKENVGKSQAFTPGGRRGISSAKAFNSAQDSSIANSRNRAATSGSFIVFLPVRPFGIAGMIDLG